nr:hypothetical protein [Salinispora arenicola]
MSQAFVVRYEMRPETTDENKALVEAVFAELADKAPTGISYASFRLADGVTFVHVGITEDGASLADLDAFTEFQKAFGERAAGAPTASGAELVGVYGFNP